MDRKERNKKIGIFLVIFLLIGICFSGFAIADFEKGQFWSRLDNTIILTNSSQNVNIGENATTIYKLKVNGTGLFDIIKTDDINANSINYGIEFNPDVNYDIKIGNLHEYFLGINKQGQVVVNPDCEQKADFKVVDKDCDLMIFADVSGEYTQMNEELRLYDYLIANENILLGNLDKVIFAQNNKIDGAYQLFYDSSNKTFNFYGGDYGVLPECEIVHFHSLNKNISMYDFDTNITVNESIFIGTDIYSNNSNKGISTYFIDLNGNNYTVENGLIVSISPLIINMRANISNTKMVSSRTSLVGVRCKFYNYSNSNLVYDKEVVGYLQNDGSVFADFSDIITGRYNLSLFTSYSLSRAINDVNLTSYGLTIVNFTGSDGMRVADIVPNGKVDLSDNAQLLGYYGQSDET